MVNADVYFGDVLKQVVVWWQRTGNDRYGQPVFAAAVEIAARWSDAVKETIGDTGTTVRSESQVLVDRDMTRGDWLYLGAKVDLGDAVNPKKNSGAREIISFKKIPDFENIQKVRKAYL